MITALALLLLTLPGAPSASTEAPLAAAGRALAGGELDRAETLFVEARDADPSSPLPHLGLADVDAARDEPLAALAHLRRAEDLAPESPEVLRRLGRLQVAAGAAAEALESLERLRRIASDDPVGYLLAAIVLRDVDQADQAADLLENAVSRDVHPAAVHAELSLLHLGSGRAGDALRAAENGLEHHDDRRLRLAHALALATDPAGRDEAIRRLEALVEDGLSPSEEVRVRLEIASLRLAAARANAPDGCDDAVLRHLRAARALAPDAAEIHYRLGQAHRACGDAEAARAALTRFRELSRESDDADHAGRDSGTRLNEIRRLAAGGHAAEALRRLEALNAERPDDDRVHLLRAKILFSAGRKAEALDAIVRARELLPGRVEAHYLEGLFASQLGRLDQAEDALRRALALDDDADAHALLAALLADGGDNHSAAEHFRRALDGGATSAAVHLGYAMVLHELGRDDEARKQIEQARALESP